MTGSAYQPVVRIDGSTPEVESLWIGESPESLVRIALTLVPCRGAAQPEAGAQLELEFADEKVAATITSTGLDGSSGGERWRIEAATGLAALRRGWFHSARAQSRSRLFHAAMTGVPTHQAATAAGDKQHERFVSLGQDRWSAGRDLALLGGQLLLAHTGGIVLARPDQPTRAIEVEGTAETSRRVVTPTILFTGVDHAGGGLKHERAGHALGACIERHVGHSASAAEVRAATVAFAALRASGEFRLEGGRELLALGPGTWISTKTRSERLVSRRQRSWTPRSGWFVILEGGNEPLPFGLAPRAQTLVVEVVGFDAESGLLKVRAIHHGDVEMLCQASAPRAGASDHVIIPPNVSDRGIAVLGGAMENVVYATGLLAGGTMTQSHFDEVVHLRLAGETRQELRKDGSLSESYAKTSLEVQGPVELAASKFEFRKA